MKKSCSLLLLFLLIPSACWALTTIGEFGVRGGVDDATLEEHYATAEIYYLRNLPWQKDIAPGVRVYSRLDFGASYIDGGAECGGWLAAGGELVLGLFKGTIDVEAGVRPLVLLKHVLGQDDFGGPIQFASHAGAAYNFGRASLNYRFQHTSNGGLYDKNPGVDLHLIGLGVRY